MTAYAEFHGQILQEVTGINIDGKTYSIEQIRKAFEVDASEALESCVKYANIAEALAPLVAIADAYDASNLDEHRPEWDTERPPSQIELFTGRGGKRLLTLADCLKARELVR